MSQESLARRVGKNRTTISNSLRLLALPPDIQAAVVEGTITAGHARALLMVDKPDKRRWLFERINGLSVREAEEMAASLRADVSSSEGSKRKGKLKLEDPFLSSFQQGLIDALGTKDGNILGRLRNFASQVLQRRGFDPTSKTSGNVPSVEQITAWGKQLLGM